MIVFVDLNVAPACNAVKNDTVIFKKCNFTSSHGREFQGYTLFLLGSSSLAPDAVHFPPIV